MPGFVDLNTIQRPSTGNPVSQAWFDQVNDDFITVILFSPLQGTATVTTNTSGIATVTFPLTFATAPFAVIAQNNLSGASSAVVAGCYAITTTGFTFVLNVPAAVTLGIGYLAK